MHLKNTKAVQQVMVLIAVATLTAAVGVVLSAQIGQEPATPTPDQGPGMMGGLGGTHQGPGGMRPGPGMSQGPGMGMGSGMGPGPGPAGGPGEGRGPGGGPAMLIGEWLRELDMTDAQFEKIRTILDAHRDQAKAIEDRQQGARKALREAMVADTADEATVRQKALSVGTLDADLAVLSLKTYKAAFAVLTPDQQKQARELRAEHEKQMKNGRKFGRPSRDGGPGPERGGPQAI
jgi:Spy/CpxP family protein refolding chaperone